MLGGYQILDLRKIDLTITKTLSNITDAYVLAQLLKLRDFIDKDYDFSKPIENQLKPVLIRYRDKKNGEKNEGAMFGELAIVDNYYTFQITGRISGYLILTIKVAFQETTNAYGAKEWVINTAKIKLQDVMDDLEGNLALEGDLDVSGDLSVGGDAEITGDVEVTGDLEADKISGNEIIETMTGYSFDVDQSLPENINLIYVGAVKNGNKLTLVIAGKITGKTTTASPLIGEFRVPLDVANKLVPDVDLSSALDVKELQFISAVTSAPVKKQAYMYKSGNSIGVQIFYTNSTLEDETEYFFRYEATFLLSDNLLPQE